MEGNDRGSKRENVARPDFRQLETFIKVAETRSFVDAARQLGVSQPAISQTIARLEDVYGGDLFVRKRGTPVALTLMGRAILPKVKLLLFMIDSQIQRAAAIAQSMTGCLTIGFSSGLARGPLFAGIDEFRAARPDVHLRFIEAPTGELHRQLNERLVDIMFGALIPDLGGGPNFQERLWDEQLFVGLRDDHPFVANDSLRWSDISSLSIIVRAPHGDLSFSRAIERRMGDNPFSYDVQDVSPNAIIELVRLGLGATIVFASQVMPREGIIFRPVVDDNALVSVEALWPKDDSNPLRHRLLLCVRSHVSADKQL